MNGLEEIVAAALRAGREGRPAVLATVVQVAGSTYRRPGARMLVPAGGDPIGLVSGGCLESDLAERAEGVLESGAARTVVYDMRSPDDIVWGLGLGCNGEVRVLLEPLIPGAGDGHLAFLDRCARERRPGVVATVFEGSEGFDPAVGGRLTLDERGSEGGSVEPVALRAVLLRDAERVLEAGRTAVRSYDLAEGRAKALVEYVAPTVRLLVFGAGNDAPPLVRFARGLGWRVTVADDRPAYATAERFPEADEVALVRFDALDPEAIPVDSRTPVLVMTHHFLHDLELMGFLMASPAPYLGFLGPKQRTDNLLEELAKRGVRPTPEQRQRLHGPVGVDLGSETPEEIALAVLAEIQAVMTGRSAGFLRDRRAPIHEPPR